MISLNGFLSLIHSNVHTMCNLNSLKHEIQAQVEFIGLNSCFVRSADFFEFSEWILIWHIQNYQVAAPSEVILNINHFGHKGGFEAILNRLQSEKKKPSLSIIQLLLEPFLHVKRYLQQDFLETWIIDVKDTVFALVLEYNDAELKETQGEL